MIHNSYMENMKKKTKESNWGPDQCARQELCLKSYNRDVCRKDGRGGMSHAQHITLSLASRLLALPCRQACNEEREGENKNNLMKNNLRTFRGILKQKSVLRVLKYFFILAEEQDSIVPIPRSRYSAPLETCCPNTTKTFVDIKKSPSAPPPKAGFYAKADKLFSPLS